MVKNIEIMNLKLMSYMIMEQDVSFNKTVSNLK